ncbi:MAG: uroporphyrinogen-III synthase [Acidobacteriota bacterium]
MKILLVSSKETVEENTGVIRESRHDIISFPTLRFVPLEKKALRLEDYQWLIISSRKVFDFIRNLTGLEKLKKIKIAVIGEATAGYLEKYGLRADFMSSIYTGKEFARQFSQIKPKVMGRVLRPVSTEAPSEMEEILREAGVKVDRFPLYKTVYPRYSPEEVDFITRQNFQAVLFTSPSAWRNFKKIFKKNYRYFLNGKKIGVIGPKTAEALAGDGYRDVLIPEHHTLAGLLKIIEGGSL